MPNPIVQAVTITNGTADSAEFYAPPKWKGFVLMAPAVLAETVNVQVAEKPGGTFRDFLVGGANVTVAAGKAVQVPRTAAKVFRIHAGGNVAADRTFQILFGEG